MKILVACEESQRVCIAFREKGHESYSCDLEPCSGGHPEWHICNDALDLINGNTDFFTTDGKQHTVNRWDMVIAHPSCTYLSNVATRHHSLRCTDLDKINDRTLKRIEAMQFFMSFVNADCDKIAIENPVGIMSTAYRKPDQIIEPYFFAESKASDEYVTKRTCLWLKGLSPLERTNCFSKPDNALLYGKIPCGKNRTWEDTVSRDPKIRSKTFLGIAKAMADQWG